MTSKMKWNTVAAIVALAVGLVFSLINKEWFTAYTLVETILVAAPLLYLLFKYMASRTILRYQLPGYAPSRTRRFLDEVLVAGSFKVVQPLCLDFTYACLVLFLVKLADPAHLNLLANAVYRVWMFNAAHISSPLKILVLILSVLTLVSLLPEKSFKKIKKVIGYVKLPLKFVAILVLFLSIDKGTVSKTLEWKLNGEMPEFKDGDRVTFNTQQQKNVQAMIAKYSEVMTAELAALDKDQPGGTADSLRPAAFYSALDKALQYDGQEPTVRKDLYAGKGLSPGTGAQLPNHYQSVHRDDGGSPAFSDAEKQTIDHFYDRSYTVASGGTTSSREAAEATREVAGSDDNFQSFLDVLTDEQESIDGKKLTSSQEILRDLTGDFLGETVLFKRLQHSVAFYAFAKDKAFDAIKEKMVSGFFYLVDKAKDGALQRSDVRFAVESVKDACRSRLHPILEKIAAGKQLLADFAQDYQGAVALKTELTTGGKPLTVERVEQVASLFPNDPEHELYQNMVPLMKSKTDKQALKDIDFDFWKHYAAGLENEEERKAFQLTIAISEEKKEILLANESGKSGDWQRLADRYPDLAANAIVQDNILVCKQNEDFKTAETTGTVESWRDYLSKYPRSAEAADIEASLALGQAYKRPVTEAAELRAIIPRTVETTVVREAPSLWEEIMRVARHIR